MADRIDITVVVDNYIDIFLPPSDMARYPVPGPPSRLLAEQGLSLWIEVRTGGRTIRIINDFGRSSTTFFHNLGILGFDVASADLLVLSHGHGDHIAALTGVLKRTSAACRLAIHPGAAGKKKYVRLQDGSYVGPWEVKRRDLETHAERIAFTSAPFMPFPDICISGEIERRTSFETGMAAACVNEGGSIVHDEIRDDQALFIELAGKGIVVVTGCCHSGLVNTIMKGGELFPGKRIYAVVGGLHLNNASERQMGETIDYLSALDIAYLAPLHCTGYYAQKTLMERFRDRWIAGTVGAQITFQAKTTGGK